MGSNATYQCRNGSSDVYTTHCTSDGVWEPNPNSTLDCRTQGIMNTWMGLTHVYINIIFETLVIEEHP